MAVDPKKKVAAKKAVVKKKISKPREQGVSPTPEELEATAQRLEDKSDALTDVIFETMVNDNKQLKRQNKVLLSAVAVILLLALVTQYRAFFVSGPILSRLDHQQQGIDDLVQFVEDVQASTCDPTQLPEGEICPPSQTEQAVQIIIQILCSSQDDIRQAACKRLGFLPVGE